MLYVVDHAQSLHFDSILLWLKLWVCEGHGLEHISFGHEFCWWWHERRKCNSSRTMLDEAVKRAGCFRRNGNRVARKYTALAEIVGVASVKYAVLSQDRQKDIVFDWNKIITLEGNSAPYLLYSYARCRSIVTKVGDVPLSGLPEFTKDSERALIRQLLKFPDALDRALHERKPHIMCTSLYELCQEFNRFYGTTSVAGAETEIQKRSRLGLVHAFMFALKSGLSILGIPVLERM